MSRQDDKRRDELTDKQKELLRKMVALKEVEGVPYPFSFGQGLKTRTGTIISGAKDIEFDFEDCQALIDAGLLRSNGSGSSKTYSITKLGFRLVKSDFNLVQPPAQGFTSQQSDPKPRIFISYRRDDSAGDAGRLYDRLNQHFGKDNIFMDIDTIEPGLDFVEVIEEAVGSCDILIALIGIRWLTITDTTGQRRLDNPEDSVRLEIKTALERNIRVIPVLIRRATMPRSSELPADLKKLARRNALPISDRFHPDVDRLIKVLEKVIGKPKPSPSSFSQPIDASEKRVKAPPSRKISLQAWNGQYIRAEGGGGGEVLGNGDEIDEWATFGLIELEDNKIGLRAHNGDYVCAVGGGGDEIVANRKALSDWETFELVKQRDDKVALRVDIGQYVSVEDDADGVVVAKRNKPHERASFRLIQQQALDAEPEPTTLPKIITPTHSFEPELILIPAGEFLMGSDLSADIEAKDNEQPQHTLYLPDYYIAKTPVTNAQYEAFVEATRPHQPGHWKNGKPPVGKEDHPVVYVSWHDALAYCRWLADVTGKGYRLPSEAEWEKAARGTDGRIYPWGNHWDAKRCNTRESGLGDTTRVGKYSPAGDSPYGVTDMAGNVWEWTRSLYKEYPYNPQDGREDMDAPIRRVVRGGGFGGEITHTRCTARHKYDPSLGKGSRGFRVVSPI